MSPIEIITIIACVGIVGSVFGSLIYKKIKHIPTGECACCKQKGNSLVEKYHKKYKCNCNK